MGSLVQWTGRGMRPRVDFWPPLSNSCKWKIRTDAVPHEQLCMLDAQLAIFLTTSFCFYWSCQVSCSFGSVFAREGLAVPWFWIPPKGPLRFFVLFGSWKLTGDPRYHLYGLWASHFLVQLVLLQSWPILPLPKVAHHLPTPPRLEAL